MENLSRGLLYVKKTLKMTAKIYAESRLCTVNLPRTFVSGRLIMICSVFRQVVFFLQSILLYETCRQPSVYGRPITDIQSAEHLLRVLRCQGDPSKGNMSKILDKGSLVLRRLVRGLLSTLESLPVYRRFVEILAVYVSPVNGFGI